MNEDDEDGVEILTQERHRSGRARSIGIVVGVLLLGGAVFGAGKRLTEWTRKRELLAEHATFADQRIAAQVEFERCVFGDVDAAQQGRVLIDRMLVGGQFEKSMQDCSSSLDWTLDHIDVPSDLAGARSEPLSLESRTGPAIYRACAQLRERRANLDAVLAELEVEREALPPLACPVEHVGPEPRVVLEHASGGVDDRGAEFMLAFDDEPDRCVWISSKDPPLEAPWRADWSEIAAGPDATIHALESVAASKGLHVVVHDRAGERVGAGLPAEFERVFGVWVEGQRLTIVASRVHEGHRTLGLWTSRDGGVTLDERGLALEVPYDVSEFAVAAEPAHEVVLIVRDATLESEAERGAARVLERVHAAGGAGVERASLPLDTVAAATRTRIDTCSSGQRMFALIDGHALVDVGATPPRVVGRVPHTDRVSLECRDAQVFVSAGLGDSLQMFTCSDAGCDTGTMVAEVARGWTRRHTPDGQRWLVGLEGGAHALLVDEPAGAGIERKLVVAHDALPSDAAIVEWEGTLLRWP